MTFIVPLAVDGALLRRVALPSASWLLLAVAAAPVVVLAAF